MREVKTLLSALAVLSLALVIWLPQRAQAATCKGASCNGLDPFTTGCYVDAYVASSGPINDAYTGKGQIGIVSLRWSPTCQAGYGQTFSMIGDAYSIMARTWGGYGASAPMFASNAVVVTSQLAGANRYCDLFASGVISKGPTTSSAGGGGHSGKPPCP
jgi:hypothetical protein